MICFYTQNFHKFFNFVAGRIKNRLEKIDRMKEKKVRFVSIRPQKLHIAQRKFVI